jgi:O-antigen/teichoic acid export membrane protein
MSHKIARTLPSLFLWQFASLIAGFLTQALLARSLGPHDKGILDLFLLIPVVLASVTELGLLSANTYFAGKGTLPFSVLHSNSLLWSSAIGVLALGAGVMLVLATGSPFESLTGSYFLLTLLVLVPSLYFSLWSGLMYGREQAGTVYFISAAFVALSLLVYGAAILLGGSLDSILQLSALLLFARAGLALYTLRGKGTSALTFDASALRQCFRYGIALWVGLAVNTLHFRVSQFLVSSMLGSAELAFYALATRIAEMAWLLDYVIINAAVFHVTSSTKEESVRITQRMTRVIGMMSLGASVLIAISSPVVIPLVFGEAFRPTILPLILLIPGIVGWSLARSLSQFIAYQVGKPWYNTAAAGFAFILNLVLNLILLPLLGVMGASLASSLSYICNLLLVSLIFKRLSAAPFAPSFVPTKEDFAILKEIAAQYLPKRAAGQG